MHRQTAARWTAVAGLVAALAPAAGNLFRYLQMVVAVPDSGDVVQLVLAMVVGAAAGVALVRAILRRDVATSALALSVLIWPTAGLFSRGPALGTTLSVLAELLLVAFGVLMLRRTAGPARVLPWAVVVAGGLWLVTALVFSWVWLPGLDQQTLVLLTQIPGVAMTLAYLAAAALFVPPLVRPVGAGVQRLWATADVR